jgi:hypothetical protein
MERAKREIPGFKEHIRKFEEQINIKSYAPALCLATPGASPKSVCTAGNHHLT